MASVRSFRFSGIEFLTVLVLAIYHCGLIGLAAPGLAFSEEQLRAGRTPYPQVFVKLNRYWLLHTYPVGPFVAPSGQIMAPVRVIASLCGASVSQVGTEVRIRVWARWFRVAVGADTASSSEGPVALKQQAVVAGSSGEVLAPLLPVLSFLRVKHELRKINEATYVFVTGPDVLNPDKLPDEYNLGRWFADGDHNLNAYSDVDNVIPVSFDLNPLTGRTVYSPEAKFSLPAKPIFSLSEYKGRKLSTNWGIYLNFAGVNPANWAGYSLMALPNDTGRSVQTHPCDVSGRAVAPFATVKCVLKHQFKHTYNDGRPTAFSELVVPPSDFILMRTVGYR